MSKSYKIVSVFTDGRREETSRSSKVDAISWAQLVVGTSAYSRVVVDGDRVVAVYTNLGGKVASCTLSPAEAAKRNIAASIYL